jgi:hypothetical protein
MTTMASAVSPVLPLRAYKLDVVVHLLTLAQSLRSGKAKLILVRAILSEMLKIIANDIRSLETFLRYASLSLSTTACSARPPSTTSAVPT